MPTKTEILNEIYESVDWDSVARNDVFSAECFSPVTESIDRKKFKIASGITKLVLIPKQESDFVIKIPFSTFFNDDFYNEETDTWGDFVPLERARSPLSNTNIWDYCQSEEEYYQLALKEGVGNFFPTTKCVRKFPYPIYIQEKCETFCSMHPYDGSIYDSRECQNLKNAFPKLFSTSLSWKWIMDAVAAYGVNLVLDFIDFIRRNCIFDLHSDNYGYSCEDGRPVLIDFSGFNEELD